MSTLPTMERIAVPNESAPDGFPGGLVLPALYPKPASGVMCLFRSLKITLPFENAFFAHWKANKLQYIRRGFGVRKESDQWFLFQWLAGRPGAYFLTPTGADILENALATKPGTFAAPTVKFEPLPPALESGLWEYQRQPARQLLRALRHGKAEWGYPGAVDLSDMGTGKTYMALAAALATGRKVVVICPPVGRPGWERAFAHFGAEPHYLTTYEAVRGGWRPQVASQVGETFTWANPSDVILILDEAQALRHDDTLTTKCFSAAVRQGIPIVMASATIAISPLEFRFAGRIVGLHQGASDWPRFLVEHGCARRPGSDAWKWPGGMQYLRRIHGNLFPLRGCRVRKESLGDACPETEINVLPIQVAEGREIEAGWRDALDTIDRLRAQRAPQHQITALERSARMKVWQRCEKVLVPHVAALAKQDLAAGKSVAIFMNFNESREAMGRLLGTRDGFFGGQSPAVRKRLEDSFQANRIRVLVSNIGAGGASVSLHDLTGEFPRVAYIFPTDHVVQMVQATGRVDRVGGKSRSVQWIPFVAGTLTERMVERTRRKMGAIHTINDGESKEVI